MCCINASESLKRAGRSGSIVEKWRGFSQVQTAEFYISVCKIALPNGPFFPNGLLN